MINLWFPEWFERQRKKSFIAEVVYEWARFQLILPGPQKKWTFENGFAKYDGRTVFFMVADRERTLLHTIHEVSMMLGGNGVSGEVVPEGAKIQVTEFWGGSADYLIQFINT